MIDVASRERAHLGYPTKVSEPLQAEFPGAELGRLLAGVESVGR